MNGKLWPKEREAQLRELHKQGFTYGRIAAELGVTRGAVASVVGRLGLAVRPGGVRPKSVQEQPRARSVGFQAPAVKEGLRLGPPAAITATFDALEPHHCRWLVSDSPYMFCGDANQDGSSYCGHHRGVANRG